MFGRCKKQANRLVGPVEELYEEVETVKSFCYLGDRVNASGGCESKSENRVGEVQGMWRVAKLNKVLTSDERNDLSELCEIGDVIWE